MSMKKASLIILFLFILCMISFVNTTVFADTSNTSNEKIKSVTLIKESFSNVHDAQGEINRVYTINDSKTIVTSSIILPDTIFKKVKDSKNPLFEAKKELTVAYRYLKLEKRLQELNGLYVPTLPHAKVYIEDSLQISFQNDIAVLSQYADSEVKYIESLSKKKQEEMYDTSDLSFADYGKEMNTIKHANPNFEEQQKFQQKDNEKIKKESQDAKKIKKESPKKEIKDKPIPIASIVLVILVIIMIFGLMFYTFQKRR